MLWVYLTIIYKYISCNTCMRAYIQIQCAPQCQLRVQSHASLHSQPYIHIYNYTNERVFVTLLIGNEQPNCLSCTLFHYGKNILSFSLLNHFWNFRLLSLRSQASARSCKMFAEHNFMGFFLFALNNIKFYALEFCCCALLLN